MNPSSLSDKLLSNSERFFPLAVLGCDIGIWLMLVPGKLVAAL